MVRDGTTPPRFAGHRQEVPYIIFALAAVRNEIKVLRRLSLARSPFVSPRRPRQNKRTLPRQRPMRDKCTTSPRFAGEKYFYFVSTLFCLGGRDETKLLRRVSPARSTFICLGHRGEPRRNKSTSSRFAGDKYFDFSLATERGALAVLVWLGVEANWKYFTLFHRREILSFRLDGRGKLKVICNYFMARSKLFSP